MRRLLIPSLVLSAFAVPASAYFVGAPKPAPAPAPVNLSGMNVVADRTILPLNHVGAVDAELAGLPAGYNSGVGMDHAFKLLLPAGWRAALAPEIGKNQQVSWPQGLTWVQAIEQVANQTDAAASIHWAQKVVTLAPMPRESSMVQAVYAAPSDVAVEIYDQTGTAVDRVESPVESSPGAVYPQTPNSVRAPEAQPALAPASMPVASTHSVMDAPSIGQEPAPAMSTYAAEPPEAAPLPVAAVSDPEQITVESSPAQAAPVAAPVAEVAEVQKPYRDLGDFLSEEIQVDRVGMSLPGTISSLLPNGWTVDVRDDQKVLDNLRMDLTYVGPRGAALNAIGTRENLVLIPYLEFSKVVVTRGQAN